MPTREEYLCYIEQDRQRKPSTLRDYDSIFRNHVLPHLGSIPLEDLTAERVERWAAHDIDPARRLTNRTREKAITVFHGVMERARKLYRLSSNPVADVEKPRTAARTEINVFSPEEIMALVRAADSEQDGAIHLTAAFTGLRHGEPIALRWRDTTSQAQPSASEPVTPTATGPRRSPARSARSRWRRESPKSSRASASGSTSPDDDDLVFAGITGGFLDGSALSKRFRAALQRAGLRPLRFHDLRHTFGPRVIGVVDIRRVQEWMGHANVQTTMQYLHYVPRPQDAALVGEAFATDPPGRRQAQALFDESGQGRLV